MHFTLLALEKELQADVYAQCEKFFAAWVLPKSRAEKLSNMFSAKRKVANKEAGTFKGTASEGLSMCSLFALMLLQVVAPIGVCSQELHAYICLANIVDLLHSMPVKCCTPEALKKAIADFLQACIDCGWQQQCHPKFHWVLHMPRHLAKWGCLPSTWVHERKHKVAKRYGSLQKNTTQYDRSILLECLGHSLAELQDEQAFSLATRLEKQSCPTQKLKEFMQQYCEHPVQELSTSHKAFLSPGGSCQKGDVVVFKISLLVGQVYFHANCNGQVMTLVNLWSILECDAQKGSCLCKMQQCSPMMVDTDDLACAVPYCHLKEDLYRVYIPLPYRFGKC